MVLLVVDLWKPCFMLIMKVWCYELVAYKSRFVVDYESMVLSVVGLGKVFFVVDYESMVCCVCWLMNMVLWGVGLWKPSLMFTMKPWCYEGLWKSYEISIRGWLMDVSRNYNLMLNIRILFLEFCGSIHCFFF